MPFFSADAVESFHRDGYVVVPALLDTHETDLLRNIARADRDIQQDRSSRADGEGGAVELVVRNDVPDDSIYGAIVRDEQIVRRMEQLLDGEVYHYHHKMILKEPRIGGAWAWHQDYGYWYDNGCLLPLMASCMIAVDRATKENGCLQVLKGSHQMGRMNHGPVGEQTGADPERVDAAVERFERVYAELDPGDAIFFHCNLLHRSDQNKSGHPRWAFICCYNAARNDPYKESRHPRYSPLEVWPHDRILQVGRQQWSSLGQEIG